MTDAATELNTFRDEVLAGAQTYLRAGPAPLSELVRVLASHLECDPLPVRTMLLALSASSPLRIHGSQVSLPAGGDQRESEERR
jgi:hypothetical protein